MEEIIDIPFKVSARTARLIGRENIATFKGAIIELVKNAYDADSKVCVVYFDNKYLTIKETLTPAEFLQFVNGGVAESVVLTYYSKQKKGDYQLKMPLLEEERQQLKKHLGTLNTLYIIDAGEGMTQNIIRDHWMTIGTDNKATDIFTKGGRVKAGAKGIGRFALDKLGSQCEMITIFDLKDRPKDTDLQGRETGFTGYKWRVNWEDFEGVFKTIDRVNAKLVGLRSDSLKTELTNRMPELDLGKLPAEIDFNYGTLLKITQLRDDWDDYFVNQVFSDLEVLVPPKETAEFRIYLFSSQQPEKYGEVLGSVCDDYDYKLVAKADKSGKVNITVSRMEYDVELIPSDFFNRAGMTAYPYRKEDFLKGSWQMETTVAKLIPGFAQIDEKNSLEHVGPFEFSFYFLKKTFSTPDAERFYSRRFQARLRKDWLDKFGGIKLFRDEFRVRPYGEVNESAFDWLGLGNRKSNSPAGIAKEGGGYRVEPENVAGAIRISRLTNVNFEDKSSREGLQENPAFRVFREIITNIISIFEKDRAYIAREMDAYFKEKTLPNQLAEKAEQLAETYRTRNREKMAHDNPKSPQPTIQFPGTDDKETHLEMLSELSGQKDVEIEKLKEEQKILRGLASSGIVLASFSHDLGNLNRAMGSRVENLKRLLAAKIDEADYISEEDRKNPFVLLNKMQKQDQKLKSWLNFSMGATRKDKRSSKQLIFKKYLTDFESDWHTALEERGIKLYIDADQTATMRVHEIDFDSIFNNLIVNSIDAFKSATGENNKREIKITVTVDPREILITYTDNGPGLSPDITTPEEIFKPLFSTKRHEVTGEEIGTGLGMWLVKSIVEENSGQVKLLFLDHGFGLRILFPLKNNVAHV